MEKGYPVPPCVDFNCKLFHCFFFYTIKNVNNIFPCSTETNTSTSGENKENVQPINDEKSTQPSSAPQLFQDLKHLPLGGKKFATIVKFKGKIYLLNSCIPLCLNPHHLKLVYASLLVDLAYKYTNRGCRMSSKRLGTRMFGRDFFLHAFLVLYSVLVLGFHV